jgi:hypothetical protein
MRAKTFGLLVVSAGAFSLISGFAAPAMAVCNGTPITDEFGFTGTSPDGGTWLESINEQYAFANGAPITDAQGTDVPVWAEAVRGEYGIPGPDVAAGTPVTDELGASSGSADSAAWAVVTKNRERAG